LLVEHPALPQPFEPLQSRSSMRPPTSLDRLDRLRVAAQLVAVTGLLSEFELWPGLWALRKVGVVATGAGPRAVLPAVPVALSRLWSRLGAGNHAAETARTAVLETVCELTSVEPELFVPGRQEPGFVLDGVLDRLLGELPRPLDESTARSLWMLRWSLPPVPEPGDTSLLAVSDREVARRLAAAVWSSAIRRGGGGTLEILTAGASPVSIAGLQGEPRLRVIAGDFDHDLLGAVSDGSAGATMVIGRFPKGWNPPRAEVFDRERLGAHLAIVGVPPARRVRWLDERSGRFDPFAARDRRAMTQAASVLFADPPDNRRRQFRQLVRVASLVRDGLPRSLALGLSGLSENELNAAADQDAVLSRDGLIMLPNPVELEVDPLHAELTELFPADDPRRLLHAALATGDTGGLLAWGRDRLNDLAAHEVRETLSEIRPGALGPGVQVMLAEACLSLADIHGAEAALKGVVPDVGRPWTEWLKVLDRTPDLEFDFPRPAVFRQAPRAAAEIALVFIRRGLNWQSEDVDDSVASLRREMAALEGPVRRLIEIKLTALVNPELLDDRLWRQRIAGSHSELMGWVLFDRAFRAAVDGPRSLARRLLRRLAVGEREPGRLAPMLVNLGVLAFQDGRHTEAEAHMLRAFRLFQAAGFRHRAWEVLHNLAVADIDQLRVAKASARLDEVSDGRVTVYVDVERARLALATGDLDSFARRVRELPDLRGSGDAQLVKALSFLGGVDRLLFGAAEEAVGLLRRGGQEALPWLDLVSSLSGGKPSPGDEAVSRDFWGVWRAAELVRRNRGTDREAETAALCDPSMTVEDAFAVALVHRLGVLRGWPPRSARAVVARVLHRAGLTGWAESVQWNGSETGDLLRALAGVVRGAALGDLPENEIAALLEHLGVEGLVVRSAVDGRELWRIGQGEELERWTKGRLELCPLGSEPVGGAAWELLSGLLDLTLPISRGPSCPTGEADVRIDGVSPGIRQLRVDVRQAAGTLFTVLIHGETGSGKEVVARELHRLSGRSGELVSVNIAAIPIHLLEAELFGSVKGAYTGADRSRRGLVSAADGGTLFLDEVGDLDPALQVKLLRFLESGEVRRVGSDRASIVDVRVVCATHRNLDRLVREGLFRQDLYFRVGLGTIQVPALRTRREDIPILKEIFEKEAAVRHGLVIGGWSRAADRALMNHGWPGNVRELKHTVEVAMARAGGERIRPEHLPMVEVSEIPKGRWGEVLASFKRRIVTEVLSRNCGNRSAAARELGITRQALLYQIKTLGLTDL
jgi:transcriptional regulator with AAA-type ATPase domain